MLTSSMMKDVGYGSLGEGEDREDQKLFGQYVQGKIRAYLPRPKDS